MKAVRGLQMHNEVPSGVTTPQQTSLDAAPEIPSMLVCTLNRVGMHHTECVEVQGGI